MKKWLGLFLFPLVLAASLSPATFQPERFTSTEMYSSDVLVFDRTATPDQGSVVDFSRPLELVSVMPNHHSANDFDLSLITPIFAYNGPAPTLDGVLLSFYTKKANAQDDVFLSDYCSTSANCMTIFDHQLTFGGGGQKFSGSQNNDPVNSPIVTASNFPPPGQSFGNGNGNDTNPIFGTSLNGPSNGHRKLVATPEPSSLVLLVAGFAGLALLFKLRG
jgi:hypothetical protein